MSKETTTKPSSTSFCCDLLKLFAVDELLIPTGGWGNPMLQDGLPQLAQEIFNMAAAFKGMEQNLEEASPIKKGHEAISSGTPQEMLDLLDLSPVYRENDLNAAMVFTERALLKEDADVVRIPTAIAFRRIYANVRFQNLALNPNSEFANSPPEELVFSKNELALLIGLCSNNHEEILSDGPTAIARLRTLLKLALEEDRIFEAYSISTRLQELNAPLKAWFESLLHCTTVLRLDEKAVQLFDLWKGQEAANPSGRLEIEILRAAHLTRSGRADDALKAIDELPKIAELEPAKALQRGLAYAGLGLVDESIKSFNRAILLDPKNIEAMLARGIQTRAKYWESMEEAGIQSALNDFKQVIRLGEYHATEATFHAGTIYLAKNQMADCEVMMRKVLLVEPNPVARRNLALALHAQERVKEAFAEYQHLCRYDPRNASYLVKYFQ